MTHFKNLKQLAERLNSLSGKSVVVGVLSHNARDKEPESDITLLEKAVINEFGATINHTGGTSYGYKNEKDAKNGKVRFLKSSTGHMSLGNTGSHTTKIPERSFLRSTFSEEKENARKILNVSVRKYLANGGNQDLPFINVGEYLKAKVVDKIQLGNFTPLAQSTISAKKSSKPLVDTGQLVGGINYEVRNE